MSIYKIENTLGEYRQLRPLKYDDAEVLTESYGVSLSSEWKPIEFSWDYSEGEGIRNLFMYLGSILIADEQSKTVIQSILNEEKIEFLPIHVDNEVLYIVNVCTFSGDRLNLKKSDVEYFKNGEIKWINKFVFNPSDDIPTLFRVPEIHTALFTSKQFADAVNRDNLTGLRFQECNIKKSFLKSFISKN